MTRKNRYLTLTVSALLAVSAFAMPAEAAVSETPETSPYILTENDTFETFEYSYLLNGRFGKQTFDDSICYRHKECPDILIMPTHFYANVVNIELAPGASDIWKAVYDKYSETPGLENASIRTGDSKDIISIRSDAFTPEYGDPQDVESVKAVLTDMCSEILDAGCQIITADYAEYEMIFDGIMIAGINVADIDATEDELNELVTSVCEDASVSTIPDSDLNYNAFDGGYYLVRCSTDDDNVYKVWEAILAEYPECKTSAYDCNPDESDSSMLNVSNCTNLLTAILEEESCDINQSGAPDLDDASLLLTHYANTAAGIAAAAEADTSSYDVNGDGTVDLDDALKIVTVYAELAAGLR